MRQSELSSLDPLWNVLRSWKVKTWSRGTTNTKQRSLAQPEAGTCRVQEHWSPCFLWSWQSSQNSDKKESTKVSHRSHMVAHDCNLALLVPALALAALASIFFWKSKSISIGKYTRFATDLANPHQLHALADNCFAFTGTKKRLQLSSAISRLQDCWPEISAWVLARYQLGWTPKSREWLRIAWLNGLAFQSGLILGFLFLAFLLWYQCCLRKGLYITTSTGCRRFQLISNLISNIHRVYTHVTYLSIQVIFKIWDVWNHQPG